MATDIYQHKIEFLKRGVWIAARDGQADRIVDLLLNVDGENVVNEVLNYHKEEKEHNTAPLIIAVCKGNEEVVDVLLIFGVDIEHKGTIVYDNDTYPGVTALWCAALFGYYNIVKILVRNGANVNNPTEHGSKPLGPACFYDRLKIAQYLVENGADVNNATNDTKNTSLIEACGEGHYGMVQYLLEQGADPDCLTTDGRTAIHESACGGHLAISKLLDKMTKDNDGLTPLTMAALNGKVGMVEYLSTLPECSREDRIDAMELLGTSFLFKSNADIFKSSHCFETAMQERYNDPNEKIPKRLVPVPSILVFTEKEECKTLYELQEIRENELALCIEALTIRERVLETEPFVYTG